MRNRDTVDRHLIVVRILGPAAAVLIASACAGAPKAQPPVPTVAPRTSVATAPAAPTTSVPAAPPGVSGRIELPSNTLVAGSTENGTFVIENGTGTPLHLTTGGPIACKPGWTVILSSEELPQEAVFTTGCDTRPMVVGIGETRLPFTLRSNYQSCSETGRAQGRLTPPCVKHAGGLDLPPPLPPARYRATFFSDISEFLPVESQPVLVVASG
jgi:hypothetical protein